MTWMWGKPRDHCQYPGAASCFYPQEGIPELSRRLHPSRANWMNWVASCVDVFFPATVGKVDTGTSRQLNQAKCINWGVTQVFCWLFQVNFVKWTTDSEKRSTLEPGDVRNTVLPVLEHSVKFPMFGVSLICRKYYEERFSKIAVNIGYRPIRSLYIHLLDIYQPNMAY